MTGIDHEELRAVGLTIGWIAKDFENPQRLRIDMTDHSALRAALETASPYSGDGFVIDWLDQSPAQMAEVVIARIHALRDSPKRVATPVPEYRIAPANSDST